MKSCLMYIACDKSEWRVTSKIIGDIKMYVVYRLRDALAVDHSGNREYGCDYTPNRDEAQAVADRLNREEEPCTE